MAKGYYTVSDQQKNRGDSIRLYSDKTGKSHTQIFDEMIIDYGIKINESPPQSFLEYEQKKERIKINRNAREIAHIGFTIHNISQRVHDMCNKQIPSSLIALFIETKLQLFDNVKPEIRRAFLSEINAFKFLLKHPKKIEVMKEKLAQHSTGGMIPCFNANMFNELLIGDDYLELEEKK